MLEGLADDIRKYFPKYLTPDQKEDLFRELQGFPDNKNIYEVESRPDTLLQGDGWRGFVAINFHTSERKTVNGIIISNSCDLDLRNNPEIKPKILFAPIINLSGYAGLLERAGRAPAEIKSKLAAVKLQRITCIFYLPRIPGRDQEGIVLLDDIHQHPIDHFMQSDRSRLFTLNMYGFYIFLIKLSIHLTRFNEGPRTVTA